MEKGRILSLRRVNDLEVEQDLGFQQRMWAFERAGWIVMLLVISAALAGFFGGGPLSLATARADDGLLTLRYERFGRRGADSVITLEIQPAAVRNGEVAAWVSSDYMDGMKLDQLSPMPDSVEAKGEGFLYTFLARNPKEALTVTFDFTPSALGLLPGRVSLNGGEILSFRQFFFP